MPVLRQDLHGDAARRQRQARDDRPAGALHRPAKSQAHLRQHRRDTGLDEKTIRNIFRDYINELEAEFRFETPKGMGIDEIHLIKPRCVISNIRNNTIVKFTRVPGAAK